jgi:hypothetical protein
MRRLRVEVEDYDLAALRQFVRSFPFAAVLPVQPLMMMPTETGVDVIFRCWVLTNLLVFAPIVVSIHVSSECLMNRKKPTQERGSVDGGLKIFVEEKSVLWDPHRVREFRV